MQRVIIHAWFPHLAAERVRRAGGMPDDQPLVLTSAYHEADLIDSACRLLRGAGFMLACGWQMPAACIPILCRGTAIMMRMRRLCCIWPAGHGAIVR